MVLAIPAVKSPRGCSRVIDGTPCDFNGCARLRTKRPTGYRFQIQPVIFPAMICGLLTAACALANLVERVGFFMRGMVADVLHAVIVFFCLQSRQPRVTTQSLRVVARGNANF